VEETGLLWSERDTMMREEKEIEKEKGVREVTGGIVKGNGKDRVTERGLKGNEAIVKGQIVKGWRGSEVIEKGQTGREIIVVVADIETRALMYKRSWILILQQNMQFLLRKQM